MPTINVLQPFSLRVASGAPVREFGKGSHTVSDKEYNHWFIQGCLTDGRAVLMADVEAEAALEKTSKKKAG